ncbi:MAG: penicillin-binding protein 1A [Burkholderiales bacterium]
MAVRWWRVSLLILFGMSVLVGTLLVLAAVLAYPKLPSLDALTDYRPKIPLRVFTADGALIAEFGEERRALVKIGEVPLLMRQAVLAAEDERFYQHGGVDTLGILRAALNNLVSGGVREGASTITMQVARNFFLTREKTLGRKFSEALLAMKIEHSLSKDQILELYLNQIYLGQRAYGFASAAQIYFGKSLAQLTVAEAAMLAGLPKAPSSFNPVVNPKRAKLRQEYVLRRMRALKFITGAQFDQALAQPLHVRHELQYHEVNADYVAEMVRQMLFAQYQDAIYTKGFTVYTTLRKADQEAANQALWQGVVDYDLRHGYRGPEGFIALPENAQERDEALDDALQDIDDVHGLVPAVVLNADLRHFQVYTRGGEVVLVPSEGLKFAQRYIGNAAPDDKRLRPGSLIRIWRDPKTGWQIAQLPQVESALISVDPSDGAVRSLVGGFDFGRNKFNHVTQAWRQPGSSFKPFIYSSALEKGFTAATVINDAPLVLSAEETGSQPWEPKNYDGKYAGPIRLREALAQSKNLVSIRILQTIGPQYAQDYITRFGFSAEQHPPYLTMALGAGSVTPLQMAAGYSVFANGGYLVKPYFIDRILDGRGKLLAQAKPVRAGVTAEQVIDPRNAFIMTTLMRDVVRFGTATAAMKLGRNDLAGKTGTTNDQVDAWFCGFNPSLVAVAWIGFDQPRTLGRYETGAHAALPIWMSYMAKALAGVPERPLAVPEGVVTVKINPVTGVRVPDGADGIPEYFYQEAPPGDRATVVGGDSGSKASDEVKEQLF